MCTSVALQQVRKGGALMSAGRAASDMKESPTWDDPYYYQPELGEYLSISANGVRIGQQCGGKNPENNPGSTTMAYGYTDAPPARQTPTTLRILFAICGNIVTIVMTGALFLLMASSELMPPDTALRVALPPYAAAAQVAGVIIAFVFSIWCSMAWRLIKMRLRR